MLPEISRAAVVGIAHEKWGEIPCALVVIKEHGSTSDVEIKKKLSQHLAKNELPEHILFTQSLPLTSSGKPDKQQIKLLFH